MACAWGQKLGKELSERRAGWSTRVQGPLCVGRTWVPTIVSGETLPRLKHECEVMASMF